MKLLFSFFLVFLTCTQALFAKNVRGEYLIKTRGIVIGSLSWNINIEETTYETSIGLKNKGFLSKFYSFDGDYFAVGKITNNKLFPTKYVQNWKTSNKIRRVELKFKDGVVEKLTLSPKETEVARIQYKKLENYKDPLSSLISILLTGIKSYTIDGRRAYLLSPDRKGGKILIMEYMNIWTDHKRNDLEYLEVQQGVKSILPEKIVIRFKGSSFYLTKI
jgi:hypothetical protein